MTRVLIWIFTALLALGGGAPVLAQSRPAQASYMDPAALDRDAADSVRLLRDVMGAMRRANDACRIQDYRDEKRRFDVLADAIQARFQTAAVSGGEAAHLRSRLDEIGGSLELLRASAPRWDCKSYIDPASPPPPTVLGPAVPVQPVVSGPAASQPLPPGVTRPALAEVTPPALPAQFCSEHERVDLIEKVYNPEVAKANANARAAVTYQGQVVTLANTHMRQGDGATWGALLAEHKAYQPLMEGEIAKAKDLGEVYARIMAIPVTDCGRVAETSPPPPAIAHPDSSTPVRVSNPGGKEDCPPKEGRKAIAVGPNGKVGSGARLRSKAASTALGIAGGLLGGGGSPLGGGGKGEGPPMVNCRIKDSELTVFRDPETGTALKVGAKRAKDTLVVFAKIDRSADNGTFQTAFLQKPDGAVLAPTSVGICDLWGEWKLTVSWTRDTYVDNQLVKHEQGGWSEGGRFALPGFASTAERPDGLWRRLGFSNASHGARMVALQYPVGAAELAASPLDLVVHVTRPSQEPVMTVPFAMTLAEGPQGFGLTEAGPAGCPPAFPGTVIADGARPMGGGLVQASNPAPGPATQARDGRPKPMSDAEPPRSETLVDLRVEAELARVRAAELGGADSPEGARRNVQGRIDALDERLRRMDEAITQVGGTIDGMKAWETSEEAREVWTKEDTIEDMLDPVENAGEAGIELGLIALGQPELAPLVILLDTSEVAIRKAAKELALRDLRQNIADQKVKLSDLYALRREIQQQRNAEARRLAEVNRAKQEFEDKTAEVNAERRSQVVERDARTPIRDRANTVRDQGLTDEERAEQRKGPPPPADAVRPAGPAPR